MKYNGNVQLTLNEDKRPTLLAKTYSALTNEELLSKREIVCLTKIDAMTEEEIDKFVKFFEEQIDRKVLPISSSSGRNIDILKGLMLTSLNA